MTAHRPEPRQLRRLLLGLTDDDTAEILTRHVDSCERCSGVLPSVSADDDLIEVMRSTPAPILPEERSTVETLVRFLSRHRPGKGLATEPDAGAPPSGGPLHFPFLAPAQQPDEIGRLGSYRILKVLGRGGMGVVFLAEDTQLQRPVAIKAMLPDVSTWYSASLLLVLRWVRPHGKAQRPILSPLRFNAF